MSEFEKGGVHVIEHVHLWDESSMMRLIQRKESPKCYRIEVILGDSYYWLGIPPIESEAHFAFELFYSQNMSIYETDGAAKVHEMMALWQYYRDHQDDPITVVRKMDKIEFDTWSETITVEEE